MQQTASDNSARDGDGSAKKEPGERLEAVKFAFPEKVKAYGRRKANAGRRRVTFADH